MAIILRALLRAIQFAKSAPRARGVLGDLIRCPTNVVRHWLRRDRRNLDVS
jgi:hypothetical protein